MGDVLCPNCGHMYSSSSHTSGEVSKDILSLLATGTVRIDEQYTRMQYHSNRMPVEMGKETEYLPWYAASFANRIGANYLQLISRDCKYEDDDEIYCTTLALTSNVPIIKLLPKLFRGSKAAGKGTCSCPICRTSIYYRNREDDGDKEEYSAWPEEKRADRQFAFCQAESHTIVNEIKQDSNISVRRNPDSAVDFCAFLKHLLRIEADLYSLEQFLAQAISKRREFYRKEYMVAVGLPMIEEAKQKNRHGEVKMKIKDAEAALLAIPTQMPFVSEDVTSVIVAIPVPRMPELQKPWFFNRAKVEAENAALLHTYEEEKAKYDSAYQRALLREQERRNAQNKQIAEQRAAEEAKLRELIDSLRKQLDEDSSSEFVNPYTELHNWSKKEVQDIKDKIQELCVARAKLLAMGIVHPKYVDIVALSTMLEYLETGRCTQLEGHEGAYNIYESEIRANRIIAQLDQVIDSLEEIKRMQYYTYQVLTEIQSNTQEISAKMDSAITTLNKISEDTGAIRETTEVIAYNTEVIAYNTEKTAYYAKMNADLTDALGFMLACK